MKQVHTNAVKGGLTAQEALTQMFAGTDLVAREDGKSGAFAIRRENPDPNA